METFLSWIKVSFYVHEGYCIDNLKLGRVIRSGYSRVQIYFAPIGIIHHVSYSFLCSYVGVFEYSWVKDHVLFTYIFLGPQYTKHTYVWHFILVKKKKRKP